MSTTEKQILSLVEKLSHAERLRVMHAILRTLEDLESTDVPKPSAQNIEVAERRSKEYDEGKVKVLSRQEFWDRLQKRQLGE